MANTVWKVDPETKDLVFDEKGALVTIEEDEASAQGVRLTLEAWKEDFELVPGHGTDYGRIFGDSFDEDTMDEVLREAIFQEPRVSSVEELNVLVSDERRIEASFTGCLDNGTKISMEVTTDGE